MYTRAQLPVPERDIKQFEHSEYTLQKSSILIPAGDGHLCGELVIPSHAKGLVLFAHDSNSDRLNARDRFIATKLNQTGFATLQIDLLTSREMTLDAQYGEFCFDHGLMTERLVSIIDWLKRNVDTGLLPTGVLGTGSGAATAICAAAQRENFVAAVVARSGRQDAALKAAATYKVPTLLIVGGADQKLVESNRKFFGAIHCKKKLDIVVEASSNFEEIGTLEQVAIEASAWFTRHLQKVVAMS